MRERAIEAMREAWRLFLENRDIRRQERQDERDLSGDQLVEHIHRTWIRRRQEP